MAAVTEVLYGRTLGEYSVDEVKHLLQKEEERLSQLQAAIKERQAAQEGKKVKTDQKGVVQRIFTEKEKAAIKAIFDEIDEDGSGDLDPEELAKVVEKLGCNMPEEDVLQAHRELDTDGNGKVNFEEFIQWWGSDVNKGRYRGRALARFRGKLAAQESSVTGLSGLKIAVGRTAELERKKMVVDVSVEAGDYDKGEGQTTSIIMEAKPGNSHDFQLKAEQLLRKPSLGEAIDEGWFCLEEASLESELWRSYKSYAQDYLAVGEITFGVAPGAEGKQILRETQAKVEKEAFKMIAQKLADELAAADDDVVEVLKRHGIKLEEKEGTEFCSEESVLAFRKHCARLGKELQVDYDADEEEENVTGVREELPNDSEDCKLLDALIKLTSIGECQDFMVFAKMEVKDESLHFYVVPFVSRVLKTQLTMTAESVVGGDLNEFVNKAFTELVITSHLGGNLSKHFKDIYENDQRWLDMFGWGFMSHLKATYSSAILEALASAAFEDDLMIPSFGSSLVHKLTTRVKVRNPWTRLDELIDYLIADAQTTFIANAGIDESGNGYKWDKEAEDQLEVIRSWGHFLVKAFLERLRLSTPTYSQALSSLSSSVIETLDQSPFDDSKIDGWGIIQSLKKVLRELRSLEVHTQYFDVTTTVSGCIEPLELIPSADVLEKIKTADPETGDSSLDPAFVRECKERWEDLNSDEFEDAQDYVDNRFSQLGLAMATIENQRGGRAMAGKDGLLFVTLIVRLLKSRSLREITPLMPFELLFGETPAESCDDSEFE